MPTARTIQRADSPTITVSPASAPNAPRGRLPANREIGDLVERSVLVRGPAGGRSTSYELVLPRT